MRKMIASLILYFASFSALAQTPSSDSDNICRPTGYLVAYFNGVLSTLEDSTKAQIALRKKFGTSYKSEQVRYSLGLNPTDGMFRDVAEAFRQKTVGHPELKDRYDYLIRMIRGKVNTGVGLAPLPPEQVILLKGIADAIVQQVSRTFIQAAKQSNYSVVVKNLSDQYRPYVVEGAKILLVAHSQGNLFAHDVYQNITATAAPKSVAVMHVAPPDKDLLGDYVLSNQDLVIGGVTLLGAVPPANVNIDEALAHAADRTGHLFLETYFNAALPTYIATTGGIQTALNFLQTPPRTDNAGFFTVTLTWDGRADIDLHVTEPDGTHVFYGARNGYSGSLDTDNTEADGPEHYTSTCLASKLQTGAYVVGVNNFSGTPGKTATLVLKTPNFNYPAVSVPAGSKRPDSAPQPVFTVNVSKDSAGVYTAVKN